MRETYRICLCCSDNFIKYAAVTIQSIKENALKTNKYIIYILHDGCEKKQYLYN